MSESDWLQIPSGAATGCLPRTSKFGEVCSIAREKIAIIDPADWDAELTKLPGGIIDMSDCVGEIYNQNGYGSCAFESTTKAIEVVGRFTGYDMPTLNAWFGYGIAVGWRGGARVGTNIDENITRLNKLGAASIDVWPRSKGHNAKPSAEAYADALRYRTLEWLDCENIAEVGSCLFKRHPVAIGWASHSELIVGLLPGRIVRVVGSYGSNWRNNGYHDEPISRIDFRYGAIALRTVADLGMES
ncbi:MAG: hypothetical protein AB7E55_32790 [Pigmentiphaga sp.]